jgi:hypothetical protein
MRRRPARSARKGLTCGCSGPAPRAAGPSNPAAQGRLEGMAKRSCLLTISVSVEQDEELAAAVGPLLWRTNDDIREVVTAALARFLVQRPDIAVEWESASYVPLDDRPAVGRCAVCNRWVYDVENATVLTPTRICPGSVVDGRLLCDDHLPKDHPIAF